MISNFGDGNRLRAVTPLALSAYARAAGWTPVDVFGDHSNVYSGDGLPEIIVPRTQDLGDYASVVARLIAVFAEVAEVDETALYADLLVADRDVIRARADDSDADGAVNINSGADLVSGARDMLLAVACSLHDPRPLYRTGANKEANDILSRMRLGQTERGSYVVTLLTPVIPPQVQEALIPDPDTDDAPVERQVTRRLAQALVSAREAMEKTSIGDKEAFADSVRGGTSANFCDALAQMIEPFPSLDISMTWARTRPMRSHRSVMKFLKDDASVLREAARSFRNREGKLDVRLFGTVQRLQRDDTETDGTVTLRASVDGRTQSVIAVLNPSDYDLAIGAHRSKEPVIAEGDLRRLGQRWHLENPSIAEIIASEHEDADVSDDHSSLYPPGR